MCWYVIQYKLRILIVCMCLSIIIYYLDVDECDTNNGGCEHNCNNNPGSYTCSCDSGFSLDIDGKGCTSEH